MAEELKLPKFLSSQEKYNKLICETNTLKRFEDIYMKLLSDEDLEMDSILGLMKIIERDVILVNELNEATALMEMTETFIKYMMMKEEEKRKKLKIQNQRNGLEIRLTTTRNVQNKLLKNTTTVFLKKEFLNVTANKMK